MSFCLYVFLQNMYYFLGKISHCTVHVVACQGVDSVSNKTAGSCCLWSLLFSLPPSKVFATHLPFLAPQVSLSRVRVSPKPSCPGFALSPDGAIPPEPTPFPTLRKRNVHLFKGLAHLPAHQALHSLTSLTQPFDKHSLSVHLVRVLLQRIYRTGQKNET